MPPTLGVQHAGNDLVGAELVERAGDRLQRALHVGLDQQREFLAAGRLELAHHLLERAAHAGRARCDLVALLPRAIVRHLAGARLAVDHRQAVAGLGRAAEAEHLDRRRRPRGIDWRPGIGHQRAHAAPFGAGNDDIAAAQRAALHQDGGDRAAAAIEFGLDHGAFGRTIRIGFEVEDLRLQPDGFQQPVDIELLGRRNLDVEHVTAERFHLDFVLQQFVAYAFRLGIGPVDLVDRHDHRHLGRLGVIDRLDRLRHDAIVGGNHEHDDVGDLGAARAHGGEGGVARRVDESDLASRGCSDLVGADVLGDAAGFACRHFGRANGVEQRSLAVVDVAHDGHHRRTLRQRRRIVGDVEEALLDVGFSDALDGVAQFLGQELGGIGIDHIVDLCHVTLLHQELDHIDRALGHAVGELLDGDGFRNGDVAHELLFRLVGGMAFQPLHPAAKRGDRPFALLIGAERGHQREPSAVLLGAPRAGLGAGAGRAAPAGAAAGARGFFFIGFERRPRSAERPGGRAQPPHRSVSLLPVRP